MPKPSPYTHTDPGTLPVPVIGMPDAAIQVFSTTISLTDAEADRLDQIHTSRSAGTTVLVEKALDTAWAAGRQAGILDKGLNPNLPDVLALVAAVSPAAHLALVAAMTQHLVDPAVTDVLRRTWTIAKLPFPTNRPARSPVAA